MSRSWKPAVVREQELEQTSQSYFSNGLTEEIIDRCKTLITDSPSNPKLYQSLGMAYEIKGDPALALKAFEFVGSIEPNNIANMMAMGRCAAKLGLLDRAFELFAMAVERRPTWPDIHYWLGRTCFEADRLEDADTHLQQAIEMNPEYHEAYYFLALVNESMGKLAPAVSILKKVVELLPKPWGIRPFPYDFHALSDIIFSDDILLDEFIRQASQVLLSPIGAGFADLHFKLGMAYRTKGMVPEAMDEFRRTIMINPKFHLARHYFWHLEEESRKIIELP